MNTPILDMLKEYNKKKRISFCMPGHKNGLGLTDEFSSFRFDVTELHDTDNLSAPTSAVLKAKQEASAFFSSDETFFLVNGSTGGIHIMLKSVCEFGDTVLLSRNVHISVINACILFGLNPVFIEQEIIDTFGISGGINLDNLQTLIKKHSPKAVLVTSPSYYGVCLNLEEIFLITHKYNIPLLVDEAHGAHFSANKEIFPKSAIESGADMAVQSAHKTLNAPNQTAFLHIKSNLVSAKKVNSIYNMLTTSSPCYVLCACLDYVRAELMENGAAKWSETVTLSKNIKNELKNYYDILDDDYCKNYNLIGLDPTRIVVNLSRYDCSGYLLSKRLREKYNIDIEMADEKNLVLIATAANRPEDFEAILDALLKEAPLLDKKKSNNSAPPLPKINTLITPQKANNLESDFCDIKKSINKISKSVIMSYPPAVPITIPGAVITEETVSYIKQVKAFGVNVSGLSDSDEIEIVKN